MRPTRLSLRLLAFALFLAFSGSVAWGQITGVTDATSTPVQGAGHDYIKILNETVNPANGSVSLRVQTSTPPGRRLSLPFAFAYDSNGVHTFQGAGNGNQYIVDTGQYLTHAGWSYTVPLASQLSGTYGSDINGNPTCYYATAYTFQDSAGARYSFPIETLQSEPRYNCGRDTSSGSADFYSASTPGLGGSVTVTDLHGTVYYFPTSNSDFNFEVESFIPSSIEDRNGNLITLTSNPNGTIGNFTVNDTLGRTLLSSSGFGGNPDTVTVAGLAQPYAISWTGSPQNFGVGFTSYGPPSLCGGWINDTSTISVISAITLPNGRSYQFFYDSTYGLLNKIVYPNGGYISYSWAPNTRSEFAALADANGSPQGCPYRYDSIALAHRYVSFDGTTMAQQQDFTYSTIWNPNDYTSWTSKQTTVTTHDLVQGIAYQTVYTYAPFPAPSVPLLANIYAQQLPVEQTVVYKDPSGNTLRTVNKTWFDQYEIASEQTTLETGQTSKVTYGWFGGLISEKDEYDFGQTTPTRKTIYNYAGGFEQPCQTIVEDGNGNHLAETDTFFDGGTTLCGANGTPSVTAVSNLTGHDETNYGAGRTLPRGNATKVVHKCFPLPPATQTCSDAVTLYTYDETGQVLTSQDPNGNITQYNYGDSYTVLSGGANVSYAPTGTTNAFLTKITDSLTHTQNFTYDFNTSQMTVSKDQNSLTTTYLYNDPLARPTSTTRPDNGQTTVAYNDTAHTVTSSKKINASQTFTSVVLSDGLGHVKQTQLTSDPQGTVFTDTTYDGLGRVHTVSNPYRTGSDPTTSSGTTTYFYDALGRKCLEVPPDGTLPSGTSCPATQPANDFFTTYSGNATTVTDQTSKSRKSVSDGLGRLTQIFEDPAGLNFETDYAYDPLGNLLSVNQKGGITDTTKWRTRTFTYDSLSRLLSSSNPEVGTITYKYDSDTNCASPNSFIGLLVSKTDARGIRTCTQYDALNREVALNYSNGDTTVTTTYDQAACLGLSSCQNIGHRTSMTDAAGSEAWSYQVDAANNRSVHVEQRTTNSITKTSTYYLDQAGNVIQAVYPTGRAVNYGFDSADRPSTATDGSNGITYATDFQTAPTGCLIGKVCYTPQGTFYALSIGQTSTFTGLNLTHSYNSRLQPLEFKASSTGGNAIDITYGFVDPITTHNAGHVYSISNNLDSTRSQNFTYDSLNRITSALTTSTHATSPAHCWGETFGVDAWGNLQSIAATTNSNYTGCSQESGFTATPDGNNHLTSFSYDPSGNTQNDGTNSYTWDAESQLKTAAGVTYAYDGDGRRVSKSTGKLYWYGSGGDILSETDASGNTTAEYIFFGGKRIAMLPASGAPIYYVEDLLGTSRVITTNTGVVCYDADFYPYGGERSYTNTCPQNYTFEGKERDTETGNDDFGARYYSNRFGRWLSADWSSVPAPVPYANLTNPQTLNLYAMVADDPESFADLDGHVTDPTPGNCATGQCSPGDAKAPGTSLNPSTTTTDQAAQPQNTYKSKDAAAAAAVEDMRNRENGYGWEYGARIHKDGDTYSYGPVVTDKDPKGVNLPDLQKNDVGDVHTHNYRVGDDAHANSIEQPDRISSVQDKAAVQKMNPGGKVNYDSYVGAPNGNLIRFTPNPKAPDNLGNAKVVRRGVAPDPNPPQ
jgi:RHS repeat-associated protein